MGIKNKSKIMEKSENEITTISRPHLRIKIYQIYAATSKPTNCQSPPMTIGKISYFKFFRRIEIIVPATPEENIINTI